MLLRLTAVLGVVLVAMAAVVSVAAQPRLAARVMPSLVEKASEVIDRPPTNAQPVAFSVRPGETGAEVAERLVQLDVVRQPLLFRYLLAFYGAESALRAGEYRLDPSAGTKAVVHQLMGGGSDKLVSVTVPEGLRAEEVAAIVEQAGVATRADFLRLVFGGTSPVAGLPLPGASSLEGYLYPETYWVPPDFGAEPMLRMMVEAFRDRALPVLQAASASGLPPQQMLVLASIVEREAALPDERPVLAGVFLNRLKLGMPLGADPTVQYALAPPNTPSPPPAGYWKRELEFTDLKVASPYNTYVVTGLPPGPIAGPGLASMKGVAQPKASNYLYFVARPDHTHALAETFEEHQANIARYQP